MTLSRCLAHDSNSHPSWWHSTELEAIEPEAIDDTRSSIP
jgi:hypothetical protein